MTNRCKELIKNAIKPPKLPEGFDLGRFVDDELNRYVKVPMDYPEIQPKEPPPITINIVLNDRKPTPAKRSKERPNIRKQGRVLQLVVDNTNPPQVSEAPEQ